MDFTTLQPQIVLGVAAHPDDLDGGAGGTMAHFARQGADVYYLILTDGGSGSADRTMSCQKLVETRQHEQRHACHVLGAKDVFFGTHTDGCLENTRDVRRDVVKAIRQVKPDVVVTWDPSMLYAPERHFINHHDHRTAGQAALDAVYPLARDHMSYPDLLEQGYEPHKTSTLLLMNFSNPNFFVDVSDTLEVKIQAMAAHASQVADGQVMRASFTEYAEEDGRKYGVRYAETFVRIDIEA